MELKASWEKTKALHKLIKELEIVNEINYQYLVFNFTVILLSPIAILLSLYTYIYIYIVYIYVFGTF